MKLFLTAVATLALLLAPTVNANQTPPYSCNLADIASARADLAKSSGKQQLSQTASQVSHFLDTCRSSVFPTAASPKNQIEDFYGLVNRLMLAQLKIADSRACISLGTATTDTWNSPFKAIKDTELYAAVQQTLAACKVKRDKAIAIKFSAEKCPLFGPNHKYSSAIRVPDAWQWQTKGATCLYLYGGKNRGIPEEEGIRLRENSPYLVLLQMEGDKLLERYIDFNHGELATKDLCLSGRIQGVNFLAAGGKEKNPLLRIKSYTEHCLRDSAAFALDAVYKIDREQGLVALDELSVTLSN